MCVPVADLFDAPALTTAAPPCRAFATPLPERLHAATLGDVNRIMARLRAAGATSEDLADLAKEVETSQWRRQFRVVKVLGCTVTVHL